MKLHDYLNIAVLLSTFLSVCICDPLKSWTTDPEYNADRFEGDIIIDNGRNGLRNETKRWPNNIVHYKFFTMFDSEHYNHIVRGMHIIESASCVRFQEAGELQTNFINISGLSGGCYSSVGWADNVRSLNLQLYSLDSGCFRLGTIVHEFLHALGFYHMQSAAERDEYVDIIEENIEEGKQHNFNKYDEDFVDNFDIEYDYGSVLHYSAYAFSANGNMTIVPLQKDASAIMGQRRGMSQRDINKLNIMYRCPLHV